MADGDYERKNVRDAELARFRRIIAEARQQRKADSVNAALPGEGDIPAVENFEVVKRVKERTT